MGIFKDISKACGKNKSNEYKKGWFCCIEHISKNYRMTKINANGKVFNRELKGSDKVLDYCFGR